jgi:prepilin-type processing-associated H-X9-DG protein
MIAIGDAYWENLLGSQYGLTLMWGYQLGDNAMRQRARLSTRKRHTGEFNLLFCDGHVGALKPSKLFGQGDNERQRLNDDHESHGNALAPGVPPVTD